MHDIPIPRVPKRQQQNVYQPPKQYNPKINIRSRIPKLPPLPPGQHYQQRLPTGHLPRHEYKKTHVACHVATMTEKTPILPNDEQNDAHMPHIANHVLCEKTGKIMTYRGIIKTKKKPVWETSFGNELGRLMKGVGKRMLKGTETIVPIRRKEVPKGRKVAYAKIVIDHRPQKTEIERSRLVVGGDKVEYPDDVSTKTVDLDTTKMFLNSVISDRGSRFMGIDIKDFYLGTPLKRYEYIRLKYDIIPQEIIEQYHLLEFVEVDGYVYFEVRKGMYGLPQAGRLANE